MSPNRARLRVVAGSGLPRRRKTHGHGRVWLELLKRLSNQVDLCFAEPRYVPHRRLNTPRRPDVWLVNGHSPPPAVDSPAVVVFHEVSWHVPELREQLLATWAEMHEAAARQCMAFATRVLVPSSVAAKEVVAAYGTDAQRIDIVPYGVDLRRFRPGRGDGAAIVAGVAKREARPYVLYVGSLLPRKNLASLRIAMAGLAQRGFPHDLVIVGAGSPDRSDPADLERAAAEDLPGAPGRVVRIPSPVPQRQLVALMGGADAFCVPSLYEGFGLVALEAMACGAPTLVSNGGSLPEVVDEAGVVVEPTAAAIEKGLAELLANPATAEDLRAAGRARAETMTWDRTVTGWVNALRRAAEEGR
ncbi:MAG TPA: glycosyltransferase family 1 protein [Acidimicrobiales bacterium]|nr:glycosyltransferase family 1 protein [Acidimicrobiales bacterium]